MAVYTFGRGEDGQLGLGDTNDQPTPVCIEAMKGKAVSQIACGSGHTIILTADGQVYTFGRGDDGRLGHGDSGWKYVPKLVQGLADKRIVYVTCGSYHTAAISDAGELFTFGGGMFGKLGHGTDVGHNLPRRVEALADLHVVQVACGSRHTVAVTDDGRVFSWGDRECGVCGHLPPLLDGPINLFLPQLMEALAHTRITHIAACGSHSMALAEGGTVYAWGEGKFGRLGNGGEYNQPIPRAIESLANIRIKFVAVGGFHSAVVSEAGDLYTFGGGEHGQLGHGDKINKLVPTLVEGCRPGRMVMVSCGWSHTAVLEETGNVYTFGNGDHGKLGHGDNAKVTAPRIVEGLQYMQIVSIASYNEHTAALTTPDSVNCTATMSMGFLDDLKRLVDDSTFSDVIFIVEGMPVHAHRAILSARCEHFSVMFRSPMRESVEREICVEQCRHATFLSLMEYIYTDKVLVHAENAVELYMAADRFSISRLKSYCESVVVNGIKDENATTLLQVAVMCNADHLKDICMTFIVRRFDILSKLESFRALSHELIIEILQRR